MSAKVTFNIAEATSTNHSDRLNAGFYGRFPFPWPADVFVAFDDTDTWRLQVNQELGDFGGAETIPSGARIWVAGCGTNQGIQTALRFPDSEIYATDISEESLRIAQGTAVSLGIRNITFERRSINAGLTESFDYVICTGVVHHNADPVASLRALVSALTPVGVLEIMVYNRFHRQQSTALQKAIRLLCGAEYAQDDVRRLDFAQRLMDGFAGESSALDLLRSLRDAPTSQLADTAIQPIEWSYDVRSLADLLREAGAVLWLPTQNMFDLAARRTWNVRFSDATLHERYRALDDIGRWQLVNLLMAEKSPWLWFYARPETVARPRCLTDAVSDRFAETEFRRSRMTVSTYVRDQGRSTYSLGRRGSEYPTRPLTAPYREIYAALSDGATVRDALYVLGAGCDREDLVDLRLSLATPYAPYLLHATPSSPAYR